MRGGQHGAATAKSSPNLGAIREPPRRWPWSPGGSPSIWEWRQRGRLRFVKRKTCKSRARLHYSAGDPAQPASADKEETVTNATLVTVAAQHLRAGVWAPQSTPFRWTGCKSRTPERGSSRCVTDVDADALQMSARDLSPAARLSVHGVLWNHCRGQGFCPAHPRPSPEAIVQCLAHSRCSGNSCRMNWQ